METMAVDRSSRSRTSEKVSRPPEPARDLVSVVIINYNYGRYLKECIESVLAQDYQPMEVIVVDDGSTDDSREVIQSYSRRVLASYKQNGGVISATNHGFELSHGSVVIFVDADDYLLPGVVAAHARALSDPGVVRSQTYMTVLNGTQPSSTTMPNRRASDGDLRDLILERGPGAYVCPPMSGNAWARSFLARTLPLPEEFKGVAQDALLIDVAPLFGKIRTLDKPGATYRLHGASATDQLNGMTQENLRKALNRYEGRIAWTAQIAKAQGYAPTADWKSSNWRLLTVEYLHSRLSRADQTPKLIRHLRSTFKVRGNILKRLLVALLVVGIRTLPTKLSFYVASRTIPLRFII